MLPVKEVVAEEGERFNDEVNLISAHLLQLLPIVFVRHFCTGFDGFGFCGVGLLGGGVFPPCLGDILSSAFCSHPDGNATPVPSLLLLCEVV